MYYVLLICICYTRVRWCKGSFGGRQGQPSARPWHLLIRSLGLAALPPPSVRLLSMEAIAYLITISSSSIDSLCDSCSACLLPTVHPGNTPYKNIILYRIFIKIFFLYLVFKYPFWYFPIQTKWL